MMGNAAIQAAERAREIIADAVAVELEMPKDRVSSSPDGRVFDAEDPVEGPDVSGSRLRRRSASSARSARPDRTRRPKSAAKFKGGGVGPSPTYSYTAAVVEVEVDPETGWIVVPRVWIAHDIGRAINPTLARGQVEGSVYMGLGEALMEEQAFRRLPAKLSHALVHKFPSILEYKSPTSLDMPEIFTELVEHPDPAGPFGAKEVGQGPLLPIMPAVANAVFDAVGVRDRRGADHAREDPARARREGRRQTGARRTGGVSRGALARAAARRAAVGRRRRPRVERAREEVVAQGRRGRRSSTRAVRR